MTDIDWKLLAVQRGIDNDLMETALREIEEFRPHSEAGDPYMQIAAFAMKRTREALAALAESRS